MLGKEIKESVNSARISAVQLGEDFTWTHARTETLRTLTDFTLTARFLAVARLRRQTGTAAKLWVSQTYTRRALLEDPKLGSPIHLPEALYLEILVGQMSAQETTVFDGIPSIGDDLLAKDGRGNLRYTLVKVKRAFDACSNPPYFRGVKTPITDLLDLTETKAAKEGGVKEKRDQTKDNKTSKKPNTPLAPPLTTERISPAAPSTNNPPNSPKDSSDLTWMQSSTGRRLLPSFNGNFSTTSSAASALAVIRAAITVRIVRTLKQNGKRSLTRKSYPIGPAS